MGAKLIKNKYLYNNIYIELIFFLRNSPPNDKGASAPANINLFDGYFVGN